MVLVNSFFVRADSEPRGVVSKPDTISFALLQLDTISPFHLSTALSGHSTYILWGDGSHLHHPLQPGSSGGHP